MGVINGVYMGFASLPSPSTGIGRLIETDNGPVWLNSYHGDKTFYGMLPFTEVAFDDVAMRVVGTWDAWMKQQLDDMATPRAWVRLLEEKRNDKWPHKCPRCGAKAYIGLNEVEHTNGKYTC